MLHPSYNDLMNVANSDVEPGEHPVVNQPVLNFTGYRQKSKTADRRFCAAGGWKISETT